MEASSPLAAMQPPSFHIPTWGFNELLSAAAARPSHGHGHAPATTTSSTSFAPGAFNFRDLSMHHRPSRSDYFSMKPVRGSSPTASLAADLSQNFHIDMSPQLPTPRRSLFTSNLFGSMDARNTATTPPLPSSSPNPLNEMMDISPLPHKQPYFTKVTIQSPTPTPQDEDMTPSFLQQQLPPPPPPPPADLPRPAMERRKSLLARPSLSRCKGYSTSAVPRNPENQLPPFKFGAGSSRLSMSSTGTSRLSTTTSMSLGECFMESPPQERRPHSANSPLAPAVMTRISKPLGNICTNSPRNGSPIGHTRRPSNPLIRPRKQFRRSLSMFEHPGDVMKSKKEDLQPSSLNTVMDVDELHQPILPHFFQEGNPDSIPRITKQTLLDVLDGKYRETCPSHMIVDCRFEYEFEGGHIHGAVNYNDKELLTTHLFQQQPPRDPRAKSVLIFHCEYSAHRAPIMARHIRQQDRAVNVEQYPRLTFPDVYILDGGYSAFFSECRERCVPQSYVAMAAEEHANTCEREMGKLRQGTRAKLSRAQTFAFGQHHQTRAGGLDDRSPTQPMRGSGGGNMARTLDALLGGGGAGADDVAMMLVDSSPVFGGGDRAFPKRLISY